MGNVQVLIVPFVVILFINLLKGESGVRSPLDIRCGIPSFWLSKGLTIVRILLVIVFAHSYLVRRHETKERTGYPYVEGDIQWVDAPPSCTPSCARQRSSSPACLASAGALLTDR